MTGALTGHSVAVFRTIEQSGTLAAAIEELGGIPVVVPLFGVGPPADSGIALAGVVQRLTDFDWVVFTSSNGVRSVADLAAGLVVDHPGLAAVGQATAASLRTLGAAVTFVPSRATAQDLAAELPLRGDNRVLAPLAELAGPDLVDGLTRRGFRVQRVEAYRLVEVPPEPWQRSAAGAVDAAIFTSPSLVDGYRSAGLAPLPPVLVSIGPRTSKRMREQGMPPTVEADPHDVDGIVAALVRAFR